nr:immunoglobulin heavy chain junction region [Mus musculus]
TTVLEPSITTVVATLT